MNRNLLDLFCCPICRGDLSLSSTREAKNQVVSGSLSCAVCSIAYEINRGVPILIKPLLQEVSEKSWLGEQPPVGFKWNRLWYLISNVFGLLFLPLLALVGWILDLVVALRGGESCIRIADVRGLLWWHLLHKRPYQHLRMLEHALALGLIRNWKSPDGSAPIIVDVGCEKSLFTSYLARLGYRAIGLDLDKDQMYWQQELSGNFYSATAANLDFVVGSATELPLKDNCVFVTAISVIEHIEQDQEAFREIGRVIGDKHRAIISFLFQDTPVTDKQKESGWKRAREHHPAYGASRDPQEYILTPSKCAISHEYLFWKELNRRVKRLVKATRILEHSMLFDYFIYVRLTSLEETLWPGKQANVVSGKVHPFQWLFELKR